MPKLKAFAIALLLGTLSASVANAQAGEDKVTKEDSQILVDVFHLLLGGAMETGASVRARVKQAKPGERVRVWGGENIIKGEDDPSADDGIE